MISGMTGFGSAEVTDGKIKALIEVKSVNHRFFDIIYHLPTGFAAVENKIRQVMQKNIQRGRVTVSVKIVEKPLQKVLINKTAVKTHLSYAQQLKREFKLANDLTLSDIIKLPGVIETKEVNIDPLKTWTLINKGLQKALADMIKMRKREGKSLVVDINDKLKTMGAEVRKIKSRAKKILSEKKKILTAEEFKTFQRGNDINEELSRLAHYVVEIKPLLRSSVASGKRMDFIAQEMQRETNTIGSKLQDKMVGNAVISLKSKIEKIREQAQNVE